ncbi:MAG: glycosyltransferase family 1 protein, partial [Bacteroidota bacterium]
SRPYFLYVGSRTKAYKNFDGLLYAFSKVAIANPHPILVVVGKYFNKEEKRLIEHLDIASRIMVYGCVNDRHLAKLYRCAEAFVYPSLYEGFGIPPLEAMICGTVVIASNTSSIPEIVGDAAILFEPTALDELAEILIHILDSPGCHDRLVSKGYKQAQKFSWRKTAEETMQAYRALL